MTCRACVVAAAAEIAYTTPLGVLPLEPDPVPEEWTRKLQLDRQTLGTLTAKIEKVKVAQDRDESSMGVDEESRVQGEEAQKVRLGCCAQMLACQS
jgi:hypothetical protein